MLVNDINSELHPLAIDVHCFDRSALFGAGITLYSEDGWMLLVPTANSKRLTATANRSILAADE